MQLSELCDVCGGPVDAAQAVRAELSVGNMMCPTAMVFHPACQDRASDLWQPDPESTCIADARFPESGQWVAAQEAEDARS